MPNKDAGNIATQQASRQENLFSKKRLLTVLVLGGIVLVGLALRISYLQEIVKEPGFRFPQMDGGFHDYWARGLATGDWSVVKNCYDFRDPEIRTSPYFRPPGYPFFLALIYSISNGSYLAARIVQMGLGLVSCVLAYFLGKGVFGRKSGLIFAALMSFYWGFIYFEGELLAPVLLVPLGLLFMYVLCLWYDRPVFSRAFIGGAFLGLFALARANILLFGPVVLGWFWWVAHRRNDVRRVGMSWLGFVLGAAIVIAPVTVRNYVVARDFVLITSNAGINLYIGNNEKSNGFTPSIPILEEITDLGRSGWRSSDYPRIVHGVETLAGRKMKPSAISSYFARKAFAYILQHPARTLNLVAIKTVLFWGPVEVSNNKEVQFEKENSSTLRYLPGFAMVLSFAVVGFIHLFLGWKKQHGQNGAVPFVTQKQFEMSVLILLFIATYFISFLPFFVAGRYRVPIVPFLLLFGAYGLYRIGQLVASRNLYAVVWALICIVLYVAASRPIVPYKPNLPKWHYDRAVHYTLDKQFDLAIEECRKAIKLKPDYANAYYHIGWALAEQGKLDEAAEYYRKVLEIEPDYARAHNNLGIVLQAQGKFDEATSHYRKSLQVRSDGNAHYNLGNALQTQGRLDEAISHYRQALQAEPEHALAHNALGFVLGAQGKIDEAISHYYQAVQSNPDYADAHYNLGKALQSQGRGDEAIRSFNEALRITKDNPEIYYHLGLAYDQQGKLEPAVQNYTEALRLKPDYSEALNNYGVALQKQGRIKEAIERWRQALELEPEHPDAHYNLGLAMAGQGKYEEAIEHFNKALEARPEWDGPYNDLGLAYGQLGKYEQAIENYKKALQLKPEHFKAHYNLGGVYYQQGKVEQAISHWTAALKLKPDFIEVLNNLAWILATTEDAKLRDPVEAVKFAESACELTDYKQAETLNTLAAAYAAAGKFSQAIETADKAIKLAGLTGKKRLAEQIQNRLQLYKAGQPYRKR